jgi:hypothetical protein
VSALALLGGVLAAVMQRFTLYHTFLGTIHEMSGDQAAPSAITALVSGAAEIIPLMVIAMVVGVHITHRLDAPRGDKVIRTALKGRGLLPMILLTLSMFTGLFALFLVPALVVAPSVGTAEGSGVWASVRRSARLSRHHRVRTFVLTAFAFSVSLLAAPLVGIVVLLVTGKSFWIMNVIAGAVNAITLPWLAVVLYLMYTDLDARETGATDSADAPPTSIRRG